MAVNGFKWLLIALMAIMAENAWEWLEMAGTAGYCWKLLEMAGNG